MRAYVLDGINEFNIKDLDIPECSPGEVLVEVKAAGICGSDIPRVYRTGTYHYPLIPGHEFSGEVVKCVEEDREYLGKRVGIFPLIPCMKCPQCKKKQYEMCSDYNYLGSRCDGGFSEYVKVPIWNLIELPESVTFEQAAMLEPMSVAAHAARRMGLIEFVGTSEEQIGKYSDGKHDKYLEENTGKRLVTKPYNLDKKITVMGLGTIGMSLVMILLAEGYKNITAVGNKEIQKKKVISIGLPETCYIDSKDYVVGEKLSDVFFDCVGTKEVVDTALNSVVPAGKICLVGNPASDIDIPKKSYWQILRKQMTLIGTWNSSYKHDENDDWHYVIDKLNNGYIHPEKMITHKYDFDGLMTGFELMRDKREEYIKVIGIN